MKMLRNVAKYLGGALLGAALVALIGSGFASPLTLFTGSSGSNPIVFPQGQPDLNTLITNLNAAIQPTGLFSASSFQIQGTTKTNSLTTGLVQPQTMISQTVKFFLTFTDSQGITSYIPVWQ